MVKEVIVSGRWPPEMVSVIWVASAWWSNECQIGDKGSALKRSGMVSDQKVTSGQGSDGARGCAQSTAVKSSRSDSEMVSD